VAVPSFHYPTGGASEEIGGVDPFNVRNFKERAVDAEDGVATIDWVVLLAALTGVGLALVEATSQPVGIHARDIRGELQDNVFETAWADNVPVGPSGEGMPDVLQAAMNTDPNTPPDGGTPPGGGTTPNPDPNPDPDPDPGGNPDPGPGPTPDPDPDPDPDPTPDPDPDPDPTPDPDPGPDPDPDPDPGGGGPMGPVVPASNIQGCPDSGAWMAEPLAYDGDDLEDRVKIKDLTIGGASTNLVNCPGIPGVGQFYANPTFTLDLSDLDDDYWRVQFKTEGSCDATLLFQDADGNFHFDDDSGDGLNSRIRLFDMEPLNGRVNIWIGTYSGQTCDDMELIMRAWD
jgi:hypothetical protein